MLQKSVSFSYWTKQRNSFQQRRESPACQVLGKLEWCMRHFIHLASGKKVTINYWSTTEFGKLEYTVNIHTLTHKLHQTNIPHTIIKYIANYKGRKAYTTFRNKTSTQRQFKNSVPQGGVLSPTLFNIYTSDTPTPQAPVKLTKSP